MSASAPKSIGSFEVERELGRGGMGVVYLARQPALERTVVLKTLRREVAENPRLEERFRREAQAAAAVHHQNVVGVYDCFTWRSRIYIAQEYVQGADLATALRITGRIDSRTAALVALELARGLEEIHARGIVHRDLKPSNVLLGVDGAIKIADFGIAIAPTQGPALTQTGEAVGTPRYMSPEQLYGDRVDERSDVFALGVILYEMLTGRPPFEEADPEKGEALLRRIEAGRYPRLRRLAPATPRWLARLVRSCLQAKAKRRPESATAVIRRLEQRLVATSPGDLRREVANRLRESEIFGGTGDLTVVSPQAPRPVRVRPALRWAAALAAGCGLAAAGAGFVEWREIDPAELAQRVGLATEAER